MVVANHLVNANSVTEKFMNMSKPFMKKELVSKVRTAGKLLYTFVQSVLLRVWTRYLSFAKEAEAIVDL